MSKVFQGRSSFLAVLLQAWLASYTVAQTDLTPCVSASSSSNPYATSRLINIMYVPSNSSTLVLDADGKFVFFDSSGVPYYSETIPLPMMTMHPTRKAKVVCAMFGSPEVYLVLSDGRAFTYQAGQLINPVTLHANEYTRGEGFLLTPKDDVCIRYVGSEMRLYQFNPTTKTVVYLPPYSDPAILDSKASARVHWNREFGGFSMIIHAKNIFTAKVTGAAPNYQIVSDSAVGTYLLTIPSSSEIIVSNVGISPTRLMVNTIEPIPSTSNKRVKTILYGYDYADLSAPSLVMDDVDKMTYSFAWVSSINDFVAITTEGQFVIASFDGMYILRPQDTNGKNVWVHPTLAETVVLAPDIAAHFTQETLQIQEIASSYLLKTLIKRPTYAVDIPGTSQAVMVYQNLEARLFDRATNTESTPVFGDATRRLRKLIRGDTAGNYYALYEDSIAVLSPAGAILREITVTTISNTAFTGLPVDSFKDFDVLEGRNHIFAFFKSRDSQYTYSIILDLNFGVLATFTNQNLDDGEYQVITVSIFPGPTVSQMYVMFKGPDDLHVYLFDTTSNPPTDAVPVGPIMRPSSEFPFSLWGPSYNLLRYPFFLEGFRTKRKLSNPNILEEIIVTPNGALRYTIDFSTVNLAYDFMSLHESTDDWTSVSMELAAADPRASRFAVISKNTGVVGSTTNRNQFTKIASDEMRQGAVFINSDASVTIFSASGDSRKLSSTACYGSNPSNPWQQYQLTAACTDAACAVCSALDESTCLDVPPSPPVVPVVPPALSPQTQSPTPCVAGQFAADSQCVSQCSPGFADQTSRRCVAVCRTDTRPSNDGVCLEQIKISATSCAAVDSTTLAIQLSAEFVGGSAVNTFGDTQLKTLFKRICVGGTESGQDEYCSPKFISGRLVSPGSLEIQVLGLKEPKETLFSGAISKTVRMELDTTLEYSVNNMLVLSAPSTIFLGCSSASVETPNEKWIEGNSGKAVTTLSGIGSVVQIVKGLTPLIATFTVNLSNGGMFCLVAQTYTKLVLIAMLNFQILRSNLSGLYYEMFQDVFGETNDYFVAMIYGSSTPAANKMVVCEAGFSKMCMLNVDDNPIVAHMMTFFLLIAEFFVLILVIGVSKVAGWQKFAENIKQRIKSILPGFIWSHNMELAFVIYLNVKVMKFPMIGLTIAKITGYGLLLANLGMTSCCYIGKPKEPVAETQASNGLKRSITRKKTGLIRSGTTRVFESEQPQKPFCDRVRKYPNVVITSLTSFLQDTIQKDSLTAYVRIMVVHDILLALLLTVGTHLQKFQLLGWLVVEAALLILAIKYQPFKHRRGQVRQVVISSHLVLIFLVLILNEFESRRYIYALGLFFFSISTMVFDSFCVLFELVIYVKSKFTKSQVAVKVPELAKAHPEESNKIEIVNRNSIPKNQEISEPQLSIYSPRLQTSLVYSKSKGLSNVGTSTTRHQDSLVGMIGSQPDSPLLLKKTVSNTPGRSAFGPKKTIRMQGFSQHVSGVAENRSMIGLEPVSPMTRFSKQTSSKADLFQKGEWNEEEPHYKQQGSILESQYKISAIMDSPQTPMRRFDISSLMLSPALTKLRSQQSKTIERTPPSKIKSPLGKVEVNPTVKEKIEFDDSPNSAQNKISAFMTPKVSASGRGTLHHVKAVVRFKTLIIGESDNPKNQQPTEIAQAKNEQGFGRWAKSAMKKHPAS